MHKKDVIQYLIFLCFSILLLFLGEKYILTPFIVKGSSMENTLINNERVFALVHKKVSRFDIVTFPAPAEPSKSYIKRVIGLPGDKIKYINDQLYINGEKVAESYLEEKRSNIQDGLPFTYDFDLYNLFHVQQVPKDKYFVMGDNRRNSYDSREIGFIDCDAIKGNVRFSFWPPSRLGSVYK